MQTTEMYSRIDHSMKLQALESVAAPKLEIVEAAGRRTHW
jgi:hypothetical protein